MNRLEKKSFYSFLGLYIFSSLLFISLIGYWYYIAQENALKNESYYQLQHIADKKAGDIIIAHMQKEALKNASVPKGISLALIDIHGLVQEGKLVSPSMSMKLGYFEVGDYHVFISDAPKAHLNIAYVVAQSKELNIAVNRLKHTVGNAMILSSVLMAMIAWLLSRLFMRPIRQKVAQIERFINDVTHELNTPITALSMASNQALKQKKYTEKTLKNISISTKQLYDIYRSLTYLNFNSPHEKGKAIDISLVLEKSISYYALLCESKRIRVIVDLNPHIFAIAETQLTLLFGNLIGNAIKYSPANSTLKIGITKGIVSIQDEGIGIAKDQQEEIFKKFKRGTEYSGGFGVGLSIVKSICDEYHIGISLNSSPKQGTEFRLKF
jgi:two-component system OmpR family sensor kinase